MSTSRTGRASRSSKPGAEHADQTPDRLDEREQIRRTFLAMALSHELKQPLNSLNLNVELLTKRLTKIPGATADVAGPLQALGRVVDAVAACLDNYYARVQPAPIPADRIALAPVVRAAAARLAPMAKKLGVKLRVDVPDDLPLLAAHAEQLGVAIENIIDNALVASPPGSEVSVAAKADDADDADEIRIAITDHGGGMNPEVARRAVEIGFSTRGADGTGLTIAKFIAYHHCGGFQVETHPGSGTTVSILLPLSGE